MEADGRMNVQEHAIPGLGLLTALATADGALQPEEQAVLLEFLTALRAELNLEEDGEEDRGLVRDFADWLSTAKSIQDNATQLYASAEGREIFPRFFAAMAVADGVPNEKERIMIGRIQAALRSVGKANHKS